MPPEVRALRVFVRPLCDFNIPARFSSSEVAPKSDGAITAGTALWLLVTGYSPLPIAVYSALGVLIAASVWNAFNARRAKGQAGASARKLPVSEESTDRTKRLTVGAAVSVAGAVAAYGMYKSVEIFSPAARSTQSADTERCYGIARAGQNDCSTGQHAYNGQATVDFDPHDFKLVPSGPCTKIGGKLS